MVSKDELRQVMPNLSKVKTETFHPLLGKALAEFQINTYLREAAFLAQLAHESGELRWFEEFASGAAYEGRRDLGNTQPGDGRRFKGRGPIQITGRANYRKYGRVLGLDLESNPKTASNPDVGFRLAGAFWSDHGLNAFADSKDFRTITKRINGGTNGWEDRVKYYNRALLVLSKDDSEHPPTKLRVLMSGVDLTDQVMPFMRDNRVMVKVRAMEKPTGYRILAIENGKVILRAPDGENVRLPLVIKEGAGFVPLGDIPGTVTWDGKSSTATWSPVG